MTARLTHLSLFTGIGGLDIAAEWAGFKTVGQCEWADYPTKVLEKHWPDVPRWRDIRTLTKEDFYERTGMRTIDLISGGFPCQPFSVAGKRRGRDDDRYLWPEMCRVIEELRPRGVIGENVAGIVNMALDTVLSDLEGIGYTCQAFIIPACAVDAPHRRDRVCIVANAHCPQWWPGEPARHESHREDAGRAQAAGRVGTSSENGVSGALAYSNSQGLQGRKQYGTPYTGGDAEPHGAACKQGDAVSDPDGQRGSVRWQRELSAVESAGSGGKDHRGRTPEYDTGERRTVKPGLGGMADGVSYWMDEPVNVPRLARGVKNRVDRLKCLGNAVVPQQFYPIFQAIAEIEKKGYHD